MITLPPCPKHQGKSSKTPCLSSRIPIRDRHLIATPALQPAGDQHGNVEATCTVELKLHKSHARPRGSEGEGSGGQWCSEDTHPRWLARHGGQAGTRQAGGGPGRCGVGAGTSWLPSQVPGCPSLSWPAASPPGPPQRWFQYLQQHDPGDGIQDKSPAQLVAPL